MMLSSTCKYALRAVIYLAMNTDKKSKIGIKQISGDLEIPTPFLGKILQSLAKHKLLSSTKGPNGGFGLGREASDIFLIDIVHIIDGMDSFNKCAIGVRFCHEQENLCSLHARYAQLREEIRQIFETETISGLVEEIKSGKQKIII